MVRHITFALLVTAVEVAILLGVSLYLDANLLTTLFIGSCIFIIVAFLMGSSGDVFTKNAEIAVFNTFLGSYRQKHEKVRFRISAFFTGSILCLIVYFVLNYYM